MLTRKKFNIMNRTRKIARPTRKTLFLKRRYSSLPVQQSLVGTLINRSGTVPSFNRIATNSTNLVNSTKVLNKRLLFRYNLNRVQVNNQANPPILRIKLLRLTQFSLRRKRARSSTSLHKKFFFKKLFKRTSFKRLRLKQKLKFRKFTKQTPPINFNSLKI